MKSKTASKISDRELHGRTITSSTTGPGKSFFPEEMMLSNEFLEKIKHHIVNKE